MADPFLRKDVAPASNRELGSMHMFSEQEYPLAERTVAAGVNELFGSERSELQGLLEILLATQRDLMHSAMPRAARITGTSQQFAQIVSHIEAAIRATRSLIDR